MNIGFIICLLLILKVLLLVGFSYISSTASPEEKMVYVSYYQQTNQLVDIAILISAAIFVMQALILIYLKIF